MVTLNDYLYSGDTMFKILMDISSNIFMTVIQNIRHFRRSPI